MPEPVSTDKFWKDRLAKADKTGSLYLSVYATVDSDWESINDCHRRICDHYLTGKVLDVGCGYGRLSEWIKDYTGIDQSESLIQRGKTLYPSANLIIGNSKSLPFKDGEFDWSVCVSLKGMIVRELGEEEWNIMEKEIKRVSKNLLVLEYSNPHKYEIL